MEDAAKSLGLSTTREYPKGKSPAEVISTITGLHPARVATVLSLTAGAIASAESGTPDPLIGASTGALTSAALGDVASNYGKVDASTRVNFGISAISFVVGSLSTSGQDVPKTENSFSGDCQAEQAPPCN